MLTGNVYDAAARLQEEQPDTVFLFHFRTYLCAYGRSAHIASQVWALPAIRSWLPHLCRFEVEILVPNRRVYLTQLIEKGHRVAIVQMFWQRDVLSKPTLE